MTVFSEFDYPSKGAGTIHACRWATGGEPIAVVQLVHGIAEHTLRYDDFARYLNENGFLVTAEDHMGHGKSRGSGAPLYFAGGWEAAVEDTYALLCRTRGEFPDIPYFIFGHSMGSFLTRTLLYRHPEAPLSGAVICGTGWQPTVKLDAGKALCEAEKLRVGEKKPSALLTRLMFGGYNKKFGEPRTPNDWICARRETVDAYTADPLCGGDATVGLTAAMLHGISMNQKQENLEKMPKELPVFFIAGKNDPVGDMGRGVERTARAFQRAGMRHVSLRLYKGRHEILNEENHAEVYNDVRKFLVKHT